MDTFGIAIRLAVGAAAFAVLLWKRQQVAEAIENFRGNFPRGGPGTPMHPSPAADAPARLAGPPDDRAVHKPAG